MVTRNVVLTEPQDQLVQALVTLEEMWTTQAIMENLYTGSNTVGL